MKFRESNTYAFCMLYPWIIVLIFMTLTVNGALDDYSDKVVFNFLLSSICMPVLIALIIYYFNDKTTLK